jgi:protein FrlC
MKYFLEGLSETADYAWERKSIILIEALPSGDTDIVNTLDESAEVVRMVGKPGVSSMFDFHNTIDETEPWDVLIERHWDIIHHIHVTDMDGIPPGIGSSDFWPSFSLLHRKGFEGWISLEIFSVPEDLHTMLQEAMSFFHQYG